MYSVKFYVQLFAVLAAAIIAASTKLKPSDVKLLLDAHNQYRAAVKPPASNMRLMTWDAKLAAVAQRQADKCAFDHSHTQYSPSSFGENKFITSDRIPNDRYSVDHAVAMWNSEKNSYNFYQNSCLPGRSCNSYKQVVWADSHQLGCGMKYCHEVRVSAWKVLRDSTLIVCKYSPQGNVQEGFLFQQRVARPYLTGPSCSNCPAAARNCEMNLCCSAPPPATKSTVDETSASYPAIQQKNSN